MFPPTLSPTTASREGSSPIDAPFSATYRVAAYAYQVVRRQLRRSPGREVNVRSPALTGVYRLDRGRDDPCQPPCPPFLKGRSNRERACTNRKEEDPEHDEAEQRRRSDHLPSFRPHGFCHEAPEERRGQQMDAGDDEDQHAGHPEHPLRDIQLTPRVHLGLREGDSGATAASTEGNKMTRRRRQLSGCLLHPSSDQYLSRPPQGTPSAQSSQAGCAGWRTTRPARAGHTVGARGPRPGSGFPRRGRTLGLPRGSQKRIAAPSGQGTTTTRGCLPWRMNSTVRWPSETRMLASPRPVDPADPTSLSVKQPAPMIGASPTRPGILKNRPEVLVQPPRSPRASTAERWMVPPLCGLRKSSQPYSSR